MITDTDITYYAYTGGLYTRHEIKGLRGKSGAHWEERKQSNVLASGLTSADSTLIFIPKENLPAGIVFTSSKDIVVKGIISNTITLTSQATISASINTLMSTYDAKTVTTVDKQLYGSIPMQHVQLSCK